MCKLKKFVKTLTEETTMSKKEYVLTMTTCLLGGLVIGMLCSPRKYTKIGCENGSNNSNNRVSNDEAKRQKDCKKEKRKNKDRIGGN